MSEETKRYERELLKEIEEKAKDKAATIYSKEEIEAFQNMTPEEEAEEDKEISEAINEGRVESFEDMKK